MIASLKSTLDKSHFSKTTSVNSAKGNVTSRKVTFLKTTCSMEVLSAEISAISQSSMVPKEMESLSCKCSSTCICSNPHCILGVCTVILVDIVSDPLFKCGVFLINRLYNINKIIFHILIVSKMYNKFLSMSSN